MNHAAALQEKLARLLNQSRALLVGINDYPHLDSKQQLLGSINDALSFWKVCRKMGFHPSHIVLLTSPVITIEQLVHVERELAAYLPEYAGKTNAEIAAVVQGWFAEESSPKVVLGLATRENIDAGVRWIGKAVLDRPRADQLLANRMLTFSGHGTALDQDGKTILALCPSDVQQGDPSTYLPTDTLRRELADVAETTTVVLDCCFAQNVAYGQPQGSHLISTLSGAEAKSGALEMDGLKARVFCASGAGEVAYQAILGGQWHGAFSWAFTVALEQWAIVRGRTGKKHSTVSNIELLFRTRMLLESLSFPQHPVLVDEIGNRPFLGQGLADAHEPDAGNRPTIQMEPGIQDFRWYKFTQNGVLIAHVLVARTKGTINDGVQQTTYEAGTEYWKSVTSPTISISTENTAPLKVEWTDYWYSNANRNLPPGYVASTDFKMNQEVSWQSYHGAASCFYYASGSTRWGLSWNMSLRNGTWSGNQTWYNKGTNNVFSGTSATSVEFTYTHSAYPEHTTGAISPVV